MCASNSQSTSLPEMVHVASTRMGFQRSTRRLSIVSHPGISYVQGRHVANYGAGGLLTRGQKQLVRRNG